MSMVNQPKLDQAHFYVSQIARQQNLEKYLTLRVIQVRKNLSDLLLVGPFLLCFHVNYFSSYKTFYSH